MNKTKLKNKFYDYMEQIEDLTYDYWVDVDQALEFIRNAKEYFRKLQNKSDIKLANSFCKDAIEKLKNEEDAFFVTEQLAISINKIVFARKFKEIKRKEKQKCQR